jgi:lipopolysaccharide/colanic/teichoic acid biosynthesis glycosyltransferase
VNGRNAISWEEKFKFDVWYVDNQSLWLDVKILWMTVLKVIHRADITQDGHATMEKFSGSVVREAE